MEKYHISKFNTFYCIGLSYEKADAEVRGKFSLDENNKRALLSKAAEEGFDSMLLISTCNRTEIYGFAQHPFQLIKLLCDFSNGTIDEFQKVASVYKNNDAINHMFRVGTGLDSQILGDFEIIGQLKKGFILSREYNLVSAFMERLMNAVIQTSKRIKRETELSTGATSVAFASVQYILNTVENISKKNMLLFGTGKIGRNTCENLTKHTNGTNITLINRTRDKAELVADKCNVTVKDHADLSDEIAKADVLIVATGAQQPTVTKELIRADKDLLILDLSIPKNVSEDVMQLPNVTLVHLDHLSKITDETIERRRAQVPLAESIIEEIKHEFTNWLEERKFAPTIKALKQRLEAIKAEEIDYQRKKVVNFNEEQAMLLSNRIIQKITKHFANHLKESNTSTEESIEFISKVFQLEETINE